MESIGEFAFEDCKRLETIELSSKLQTIENEAFVRCGLKYLEIPASVTNIDEEAFEASFISDFTVPNHIKRIAHTACSGCKSLKTVHIPKSVNEIGVRAFDECKQLESVSIEADIKELPGMTPRAVEILLRLAVEMIMVVSLTREVRKSRKQAWGWGQVPKVEVFGENFISRPNPGFISRPDPRLCSARHPLI